MTGFANHASDATLYAWRECPNYHERAAAVMPAEGTPEWFAAEEKRMEAALDDEMEEDSIRERDEARRGKDFWRSRD
jgi:hypothetical protein